MLLTLSALALIARAQEDPCSFRSWPEDGATGVPSRTRTLFFEGGGTANRQFEVEILSEDWDARPTDSGIARVTLTDEVGPDRTLDIRVSWEVDEVSCQQSLSFSTTAVTPPESFDGLTLDRFLVTGGTYHGMELRGSLVDSENQVLFVQDDRNNLDIAWAVPTPDAPGFAFDQVDEDRSTGRACVTLVGYSPVGGIQSLERECAAGCTTAGSAPTTGLSLAALVLMGFVRRRRLLRNSPRHTAPPPPAATASPGAPRA